MEDEYYHEFLEKEKEYFLDMLVLEKGYDNLITEKAVFRPFDTKEEDTNRARRGWNTTDADYPLGFNLTLKIPKAYIRRLNSKDAKDSRDICENILPGLAKGFFTGKYTSEDSIEAIVFESQDERTGEEIFEICISVVYDEPGILLEDHPMMC